MSDRSHIYGFLGQQINIGLSSIIGVTVVAGQIGAILKYSSGGTLFAGGASVQVGLGYLVSSGEALNLDSSGTIYLASGGATTVAYMLRGTSAD